MSPAPIRFSDGTELPVGTVFCIGRNYAAHAKEMGSTVPEDPIVFLKPATSIVHSGSTIHFPTYSNLLHHEVELVVAISRDVSRIGRAEARTVIAGIGVGIDLTLRDLQDTAKRQGHPWAIAKGFPGSAPLSSFISLGELDLRSTAGFELRLSVNGQIRQCGATIHMERPIEQLVEFCASRFHLRRGDLIFTGTPEGVGPVSHGDHLRASLHHGVEELTSVTCTIAPREH